jgi:hypothetical protein
MRTHLGTRFEIWTGQQSWFWRFSDPSRAGGSIGAAATEIDAVREACLAIEEMHADQAARPMGWEVPSLKALKEFESTAIGWHLSLARLENYLAHIDCPSASISNEDQVKST